jgi:hypothetical protein
MIPLLRLIAHHRMNGFNIAVGIGGWLALTIRSVEALQRFFVFEGQGKADDPDIERKRLRQDPSLGMLRNAQ